MLSDRNDRARLSRLERGGKPLRIIGPDPANVAILEVQLDCVEPGDVIEAPAWSHPDSKSVQPSVAHNPDVFDIGERNAIIPKSWSEIPANLAAAHFYRQGREEPRRPTQQGTYRERHPWPLPRSKRRQDPE
jgi:hypothetical protein